MHQLQNQFFFKRPHVARRTVRDCIILMTYFLFGISYRCYVNVAAVPLSHGCEHSLPMLI